MWAEQGQTLVGFARCQCLDRHIGGFIGDFDQLDAHFDAAILVEAENTVCFGCGGLKAGNDVFEVGDQAFKVWDGEDFIPGLTEEPHEICAQFGIGFNGIHAGHADCGDDGGFKVRQGFIVHAKYDRCDWAVPTCETKDAVGVGEQGFDFFCSLGRIRHFPPSNNSVWLGDLGGVIPKCIHAFCANMRPRGVR